MHSASKPYLNPITIHDPIGEAYRMCQMGAREMMIREVIMNAIERVTSLPSGQRLIRLYGADVSDMPVQKLAIWNRGGMDLPLLKTFSLINVHSKRVSVDANFGRGAKIASLMSNMLGMRFRSCTNGRVYEVQLAVDPEEKTVGRVEFADAIAGESFIRDVTKEYQADRGQYDFLNTNTDWTEVVLLGNKPDQNTTAEPYLGLNLPESKWLWAAIGMRFFNVPDGIDLSVNSKITRYKAHGGEDGHWYRFYPMMQTMRYAHRHECVAFDRGQVWYIQPFEHGYGNVVGEGSKDPTRRRFASTHADRPFGGLLWRDEIHNLHYGTGRGQTVIGSKSWPQLALRWGLVRAYSHVCVLVELNDDEATNDINRVQLVGRDGVIVDPEVFADVVRENMPAWVKEIERSLAPKEDESARNIREYLRQLMRDFENLAANPVQGGDELGVEVENDDGQGDGIVHDGTGGGSGRRQVLNPDRQPNAARRKRPREVPNAEWVDEKWFAEHNAAQMACQFSANAAAGTSTLYFNRDHMVFRDLKQRLADKAPDSGVPEVILDIAEKHAKAIFYKVAGTHVVGAFSLDKSSHIAQEQIDQALIDIVLTGVLATARCSRYFLDHVKELRLELRQRIFEAA